MMIFAILFIFQIQDIVLKNTTISLSILLNIMVKEMCKHQLRCSCLITVIKPKNC